MQRQFDQSDSGSWVEASGLVRKLLPDDNDGSGHQRFVLDTRNGQTLLVAHNIELATRVPVGLGDRVRLRGLYEWNDQGGVVHWTHRDPLGEEEGGYVIYRTRTYQ